MTTRRDVIRAGLAAVGLGLCGACRSGSAARVRRVGTLAGAPSNATIEAPLTAFRQSLTDLGYVEGRDVLFETRFAAGDDHLDEPAADLARLGLDVIVASSTAVAQALRRATATTPIVSVSAGEDPVAGGLAASYARPGGTVTGLYVPRLIGKQLQLLHDAVPSVARPLVLLDATKPTSSLDGDRAQAEAAAPALSLQPRFLSTRGLDGLEAGLAAAVRERADALFVTSGPLITAHQDAVAQTAVRAGLPSMFALAESVAFGGLIGHGPVRADMYRRAATYVDRILKGADPADLPLEQPTRFYLGINLRTAGALGLTIPEPVLLQATEVVR